MNGENYAPYFYNYPPNQTNNQSWNNWNYQQPPYMHQNFSRAPPNHNHPPPPPPPMHIRPPAFHNKPPTPNNNNNNNNNNRPYYRNNRYPPGNQQYAMNGSSGPPPVRFPNPQNTYKRPRSEGQSDQSEPHMKPKKKKKSLSQNVPRRDWTLAEAKFALSVEKELNKKSKLSLIIKFPDQELNKEIVTRLNPAIDSVHFQQPCTPRFCYVTLQDSANAAEVISELNKKQFGNGFITAEFKRDREEDLVVNAEDIDPLTLYVGNLAQEVTKEDIQSMFPSHKRMDIGFAKKMKFTRYAFIVFKTIKDSLAAFRSVHNRELHSKSLIVRFRRLHGTVGMPGEAKLQNPPKSKDDSVDNVSANLVSTSPSTEKQPPPNAITNGSNTNGSNTNSSNANESNSLVDVIDMIPSSGGMARASSVASSTTTDTSEVNVSSIKREQPSPTNELVSDNASSTKDDFNHKPLQSDVKFKIKEEVDDKPVKIKTEVEEDDSFSPKNVHIKSEPDNLSDEIDWNNMFHPNDECEDEENNICMTDFDTLYENMVDRANRINSYYKGN